MDTPCYAGLTSLMLHNPSKIITHMKHKLKYSVHICHSNHHFTARVTTLPRFGPRIESYRKSKPSSKHKSFYCNKSINLRLDPINNLIYKQNNRKFNIHNSLRVTLSVLKRDRIPCQKYNKWQHALHLKLNRHIINQNTDLNPLNQNRI